MRRAARGVRSGARGAAAVALRVWARHWQFILHIYIRDSQPSPREHPPHIMSLSLLLLAQYVYDPNTVATQKSESCEQKKRWRVKSRVREKEIEEKSTV